MIDFFKETLVETNQTTHAFNETRVQTKKQQPRNVHFELFFRNVSVCAGSSDHSSDSGHVFLVGVRRRSRGVCGEDVAPSYLRDRSQKAGVGQMILLD